MTDGSKEEVHDIVHVHTVTEGLPGSYKVMLEEPIEMELDTGTIQAYTGILSLGYPDNKFDILGMCKVEVTTGDVTKQLPLAVCKGRGVSLLGRN